MAMGIFCRFGLDVDDCAGNGQVLSQEEMDLVYTKRVALRAKICSILRQQFNTFRRQTYAGIRSK